MTTIIEQPTFAELMDALRYALRDSLTCGVTAHGVTLNTTNCSILVTHDNTPHEFYCDINYCDGKALIRTSNIYLGPAQLFAFGVPKLRDQLIKDIAKELRYRIEKKYVTGLLAGKNDIGLYSAPPANWPRPYDSLFTGRYLLPAKKDGSNLKTLTLNVLSQCTDELMYMLRGDITAYDTAGTQLYNLPLRNISVTAAELYDLRKATEVWAFDCAALSYGAI